ncbi:MAG: hypothetical protein PSV36_01065 [Algoriphagus sp.]|nr:hypothetical protein [Algoriphagus sp.]
MRAILPVWCLMILLILASCETKVEEVPTDFGFDYQPLEIGLFWIYEVDQTTYFGENDSEDEQFFYRDLVRTFYLNEEKEQVFVITRAKSTDRTNWTTQFEYTLLRRDFRLLRTIENQTLVNLVFPPELGKIWDGNIYRNQNEDEFEIDSVGISAQGASGFENVIRVYQEESDDKITYRDNRYEVFEKGVGMIEKYDEILTYCSRNDCLGEQLIDGGSKVHMKLVDYGKQ